MFNVAGGEITATEPVIADGQPRPVSAEGCTGSERVEFSDDGMRAYTRSEFECGPETRQGSGVMSFVAPNQWIDVRALTVSGEPVAWAQGYELATAEQLAAQRIDDPSTGNVELIRAARVRAARGIEVEDVEDVARHVDARAVEVWVAANETPFDLDGGELVRLADAGIPESVIDVMVAVSYPDRFTLSPEGAPAEAEPTRVADAYGVGYRRGYRSYLWSPFWGPASYGYSPYYSRFGYYGYGFGGYGGYWGYAPATIIVRPAQPVVAPPRARVVPGRGYVRDTNGGSSSSGTARPSASSGGGGGDSGGGGSSGGGGGGGSSSSSGGGRRAVPRN
jgi:hypothetical protein